jgi:predicted O-linked N-acetylglucosamine transferase (SPINDLY family)
MHQDAIRNLNQAIKLNPSYAEAYLNKGISLSQIRRFSEADIQYDEALKIKKDYVEALFNKGIALYELGQIEASLHFTGKAIKKNPNFIEGWVSRANLLLKLGLYQDSIEHLEYALNLDTKFNYIEGNLLHSRMIICDWSNYNQNLKNVIKKVKFGAKAINPFALSALVDDGSLIKYCAELFIGQNNQPKLSASLPKHPKKNRITIGYYSANFYNHAIGYLIAELFHLHDKEKFDLVGFSFGPTKCDETQQKIANEFDRFHILENKTDEEIVALSHKEKIDIAIDLIGFTENIRTSVFDLRVAPIQVNYLGYPGTMGSKHYDYIIADEIIIPKQFCEDYVEKIAYMPDSYQVNDRRKKISNKEFLKNDLELPQGAFVFASFNNNYKITPITYDVWMKILSKVNNSVLWLLADNIVAKNNLLDEASSRGIEHSRLIFAERCNLSDHLARHRQADLFLDTFPYNAHTTASDALWAGMPIITLMGNSFASRVAASLLNAVNMPELITSSQEEYEALAIDLATNPEKLYAIKQKLAKNLVSEPLFDTPLFTRNIEALYIKMYQRYHDGLSPDHLSLN